MAIPKTMDNDILWAFRSLGFVSAVEKAKELLAELHVESRSNSRLLVVQLFGSDSGFVVCDVALSTGVCSAILIPEIEFSMTGLCSHICTRLRKQLQGFRHVDEQSRSGAPRPHGIVLMAETAIPTDVMVYLDQPEIGLTVNEREAVLSFHTGGRRVHGHTPQELRPAALKIVHWGLARAIRDMATQFADPYWNHFQVVTNEPRHVIRAVPPIVLDVVVGQRLGTLAVDTAMAGYTDTMVTQWLTEYALVPLKLVALGRKRVPRGYFLRAALASTDQPDPMIDHR